ncbi:uncharacterized protein LOC133316511 [Gastrolobium bilobum]|uniref:uncharacterized protein LOC133316511 n=1 Tax=Gastrolobium bilobum TaxID=150636 RepID=UPI002AB0BDB1|nr:uncharacterized protein LOC133316511 [Gastrolobium bilobum]
MKVLADKQRQDRSLEVGDYVLVKLQPNRQISVAKRSSHKLAKRFFGPFQVTTSVGSAAYRVQLPKRSRIHPVFHISVLKKFYGDPSASTLLLPLESIDNCPMQSPIAILGSKLDKGKRKNQRNFFV